MDRCNFLAYSIKLPLLIGHSHQEWEAQRRPLHKCRGHKRKMMLSSSSTGNFRPSSLEASKKIGKVVGARLDMKKERLLK